MYSLSNQVFTSTIFTQYKNVGISWGYFGDFVKDVLHYFTFTQQFGADNAVFAVTRICPLLPMISFQCVLNSANEFLIMPGLYHKVKCTFFKRAHCEINISISCNHYY